MKQPSNTENKGKLNQRLYVRLDSSMLLTSSFIVN